MTNVLFVCTGNTCRSPMAEAILRDKAIVEIEVRSAGIFAQNGSPASENTKKILDEHGIVHHHEASILTQELVNWSNHILTMTEGHKTMVENMFHNTDSKVFTLTEFANIDDRQKQDIGDPFGGSLELYRKTFSEIKEAIEKVAEQLQRGN